MTSATPLELTRAQILAGRRRTQALGAERLEPGAESLRRAAWAGLQDSVPRSALLSVHARVSGTPPELLDDPALAQVWGPRYTTYVVAAADVPVFTLGRIPGSAARRRFAEDIAARLHEFLGGRELTVRDAGRGLGVHPNALRYAAPTGRVLVRWRGAGEPTVRTVPPPAMDAGDARLELARRHLHLFGPATADAFARWAGIGRAEGRAAFTALRSELLPVRSPIGDAWLLLRDEPTFRGPGDPPPPARLLPSGDTWYLLQGADRELLVEDATQRSRLWTTRVWPGAVLLDGEVAGTWRRSGPRVEVEPWRDLTAAERDAVETGATSLPLPSGTGAIALDWTGEVGPGAG